VLAHVLLATAFVVSLVGVGAAAGTVDYPAALLHNRVSSTLQYPNSLAGYLMIPLFLSLGLWLGALQGGEGQLSPARVPTAVYAALAYTFAFTILFTYSRGGWLILPFTSLVFLLLVGRRGFLRGVLNLGIVALPVVLAAVPADRVLADGSPLFWAYFLSGLGAAALLEFVLYRLGLRLIPVSRAVAAAVGVVTLLGVALGAYIVALRPDVLAGVVPASVLARIKDISLSAYSASSRILWTLDAFKIVKDNPILGIGGDGWEVAYQVYQSYAYWSTEVHNHYLQVWVEAGTLGFLAFAGFIALTLYGTYRLLVRSLPADRMVLAGIGVGFLSLALHSGIDFNLSLAAVSFMLFATAGLARAAMRLNPEVIALPELRLPLAAGGGLGRVGAWALALFVLILCGSFVLASYEAQEAVERVRENDLEAALESFERAIDLDPMQVAYRLDAAKVADALSVRDKSLLQVAREHFERAVDLQPTRAKVRSEYAAFLLKHGDIKNALAEFRAARERQPHHIRVYEDLVEAYFLVAKLLLQNGRLEEGRVALEQIPKILETRDRVRAAEPAEIPDRLRLPEMTERLAYGLGRAQVLMLRPDEALTYLQKVSEKGERGPGAVMWRGLALVLKGDTAGAQQAFNRALDMDPSLGRELEELIKLILSLKGS